jgi:TPR repeat protein
MFIRLIAIFTALLLTFSALANEYFDKGFTAYKAKDYVNALLWYKKAANQEYSPAQRVIGTMYFTGTGIKKDYVQAMFWYKKAANQEDAFSQNVVGYMYEHRKGVKRDYVKARDWYFKAANQGNIGAQYHLGHLYERGKGFKSAHFNRDNVKAVTWYQKAANQGHAKSQYNLGYMYQNGQGVKEDDVQAAVWYQKAAVQGNKLAQYNLGLMYANGQGIKKDLNKALALYKQLNTKSAKKKYVALEKILNCEKTSKTKLFKVNLKCADRDILMAAAKKSGAVVKREDKKKWGDYYLTSRILKGSSELSINYTVDDYFAQAQYTFPSHMDSAQVTQIKSFVSNKYGKPSSANGRASLGAVTYKWKLEDGIELKVHRGWPNTTTYLTYTFPENSQAMKAEQDKQEKARKAKEYEAQTDAF